MCSEDVDEEVIIHPFGYWANASSTHELGAHVGDDAETATARCKAKAVAGVDGE